MPRATVDQSNTERFDLKTLPATDTEEGGFVILRRLSFGQKLKRRAMVSAMKVDAKNDGFAGEINMISEAATRYDFQNCIVDHNLEDESGRRLNFSDPSVFLRLDPRVGEEIDTRISELNNFEDEDEVNPSGNSQTESADE